MLNATPNILGEDAFEIVDYSEDTKHFYYLDPSHAKDENIFFMDSSINFNNNGWDIFEFTERDVQIFEHAYT